jgi:hypothetical protein
LFDRLEAFCKVGANLANDGDVLSAFMQLDAVAVEFYFVEPTVAGRRTIAADWRGGDDKWGVTLHASGCKKAGIVMQGASQVVELTSASELNQSVLGRRS